MQVSFVLGPRSMAICQDSRPPKKPEIEQPVEGMPILSAAWTVPPATSFSS